MQRISERTLEAINKPRELLPYIQGLCGKDKDGKGFICPTCGNGSHGGRGEGVRLTNKGLLYCTGCQKATTPINIIRAATGKTFSETVIMLANELGVDVEYDRGGSMEIIQPPKPKPIQELKQTAPQLPDTTDEAPQMDYTEYLKKCYDNRANTSYWQSRGITAQTIENYRLGYDDTYRVGNKVARVAVIPCGKYFYVARDIDKETTEGMKVFNPKEAKTRMFNTKALRTENAPIFITEGAIDALSIIDVGGVAVGLNSTSNIKLLVEECKKQKPKGLLVIAMDYDTTGKKAAEKLKSELDNIGVESMIYELTDKIKEKPYKDANEYLIGDRAGLQRAIAGSLEEWRKKKLVANSDLGQLDSILQMYKTKKEIFPTGFSNLDTILGGGLYAGLYIVGAISSLGKTTFIRQIACNLARAGKHVLYFSLEMSTGELIAKDISNLSFRVVSELHQADAQWNIQKHALTTREIMSHYETFDDWKKWALDIAVNDKYRNFAGNIWTYAKVGDLSIADIELYTEKHIKDTGEKPVVFIDYLQIMKPVELIDSTGRVRNLTDKQNIDEAVKRLKLLAEKLEIPVVAISSFNRANYLEPVSMASYKESGAIEYSSDCLIGLQYQFMEYQKTTKQAKNGEDTETWEADKDRNLRIRESVEEAEARAKEGQPNNIQCKVLKNRNGYKGNCYFNYYAKFNYYESTLLPTEAFAGGRNIRTEKEDIPFVDAGGAAVDHDKYIGKIVNDYMGESWKGLKKGSRCVMRHEKTKKLMPLEKWLAMNEAGEKAKQTAPQYQQMSIDDIEVPF